MSAIPPDIAGAAAQAGFTAASAARPRDADKSTQARIADQQQEARVDKAGSVEADDLDTAVFADAEGAGSQGRPFDDSSSDNADEQLADDETSDDGHLDIQA